MVGEGGIKRRGGPGMMGREKEQEGRRREREEREDWVSIGPGIVAKLREEG